MYKVKLRPFSYSLAFSPAKGYTWDAREKALFLLIPHHGMPHLIRIYQLLGIIMGRPGRDTKSFFYVLFVIA